MPCVQSDTLYFNMVDPTTKIHPTLTCLESCSSDILTPTYEVILLTSKEIPVEPLVSLFHVSNLNRFPNLLGLLSMELKLVLNITGEANGVDLYQQMVPDTWIDDMKEIDVWRVYVLVVQDHCPLSSTSSSSFLHMDQNDHILAFVDFLKYSIPSIHRIHWQITYNSILDSVESRNIVEEGVYVFHLNTLGKRVLGYDPVLQIVQGASYRIVYSRKEFGDTMHNILNNPNTFSGMENMWRIVIMSVKMQPLFMNIPINTKWYKMKISLKQLKQCRIIQENSWFSDFPPCSTVNDAWNAIEKAIENYKKDPENFPMSYHVEKIYQLQQNPWSWKREFVLTGDRFEGTYTIWDGNHRALALVGLNHQIHPFPVYLGISNLFPFHPLKKKLYC